MNLLRLLPSGLLMAGALVGCGRSDQVVMPENPTEQPPPNALQQSGGPADGPGSPGSMPAPPKTE